MDDWLLGHVLTRIVYKGAYALGVLHDYDEECTVLRALLAQKVWRRGKRGCVADCPTDIDSPPYLADPRLAARLALSWTLGLGTSDSRSS